ncbi:hypothetical protein H4R19_002259, partial [Coemansia spiralis]
LTRRRRYFCGPARWALPLRRPLSSTASTRSSRWFAPAPTRAAVWATFAPRARSAAPWAPSLPARSTGCSDPPPATLSAPLPWLPCRSRLLPSCRPPWHRRRSHC